jgi:hypothetical protein
MVEEQGVNSPSNIKHQTRMNFMFNFRRKLKVLRASTMMNSESLSFIKIENLTFIWKKEREHTHEINTHLKYIVTRIFVLK